MEQNNFNQKWAQLHGNVEVKGFVRVWLAISYGIVKVLAKIKVNPNLLTFLGLVFSILVWMWPSKFYAALFLLIALVFDGIDGSMAIVRERTSKRGAVIDSVVDRISEVFWTLALYRLGVNSSLLFVIVLMAFTQEYMRARAGGIGESNIGVVTFAERPVRAILIMASLICYHVNETAITSLIFIWFTMQLVALIQITRSFSKQLLN